MMEIKLSTERTVLLVIPLYNHAAMVSEVIGRARATGLPLLIVDDGSTDGGLSGIKVAEGVEVIRFPSNRGKGKAIMAAAEAAAQKGFDAILTIDADGQHDPADALRLVEEAWSGFWPAIVIGDRRMIEDTVPDSSRFGRVFSNFWVRLECGAELDDTQSGLRLYPVKELLALQPRSRGYDFEIESLVGLVWGGVSVRSVPVSVHYPPAAERISHFNMFRDNLRLSWLHSRLVCRRLLPWPHKRLVPVVEEKSGLIQVKHPLRTLRSLCAESASPFWLAVAVWIGLFLGALPLLACHTVVILYVAYCFRLNKVAAVAASQFCMPPVVPMLCIEAGYWLRSGEFLTDFGMDQWLLQLHYRLWDWLLGSLLIGPLLGFLGAFLVFWGSRLLRRVR